MILPWLIAFKFKLFYVKSNLNKIFTFMVIRFTCSVVRMRSWTFDPTFALEDKDETSIKELERDCVEQILQV